MHRKTKSCTENGGGNVKVICRFRPFNRTETEMGTVCPIKFIDHRTLKIADDSEQYFSLDYIFEPEAHQSDLYEKAAAPLVTQVLEGFNGTIFAYGQTGINKKKSLKFGN